MHCFIAYHLGSGISKCWKGCLLLFLHRKAVQYIFGSWISGVFTDWSQKAMALLEKEHLCVWYLSQWQRGDLGHFAEATERVIEMNMKRERVITDYRLNLLFMETNSSKLRSELLWHMPMCRRLMRTSTHPTEERCCLTPFFILRQGPDFEISLFHCFPVSYQFYNAFFNPRPV